MYKLKREFLGSFLRKKRLESQLSVKQIAEKLGVEPHVVYTLEKGTKVDCVHLIKRLFTLYGIKYDKEAIDAQQKRYLSDLKKSCELSLRREF